MPAANVAGIASIDGAQVRRFRKAARLSQFDLGMLSGVRPEVLRRIETGRVLDPSLSTAVKLARAFGVPLEEILAS